MKTNRLVFAAFALTLAIIGVVGYKLWRNQYSAARQALQTLAAQRCDPAQRDCTAELPDGGRLEFAILPAPIRPLQPFRIEVALKNSGASQISVEFDGTQMSMGTHRIALQRQNDRFSGEAMLPVCTTGAMEWSATLIVLQNSRTLAVPFHFDVAAR